MEKLDPRPHFKGEREISQDTYRSILDIETYTSRRTLLTSMKCLGRGTKDSGFSFSACINCSRFSVAFQSRAVGTRPTCEVTVDQLTNGQPFWTDDPALLLALQG